MKLKNSPSRGGDGGRSRILATVTLMGSSGPLRFLVHEGELVETVITTALKSYSRQRRLPVLGSDVEDFLLYYANGSSDALSPEEPINSMVCRRFILCKKQREGKDQPHCRRKGRGSWKAMLNLLSFRVSSY
ncbi:uncharacterized protein [Typha angustifolia]|uniref:uncharacterized protein n=1 Tax=Typha angustifolia TaxID=59011 RepID=UPI003C2D201A